MSENNDSEGCSCSNVDEGKGCFLICVGLGVLILFWCAGLSLYKWTVYKTKVPPAIVAPIPGTHVDDE